MAVQIKRQLFTVEDYYKMADVGILKPEDRVELIKGEIIKMSPIKSFHAGIVNFLNRTLIKQLSNKVSICIQNPVNIDKHSEPEPDVVVAKFRKDDYRHQHPRPEDIFLVIEVADTSIKLDRQVKLPLYAEAGIPEYWIVNLKEQQVEIYSQPIDKEYTITRVAFVGETIACSTIDFELEVKELF
ncbi:MAG: Uma2 family endonuclease [Saprospiraceae bacterium]|nr:Uma2 family endonuclease [Saprospiraceae bacterium]